MHHYNVITSALLFFCLRSTAQYTTTASELGIFTLVTPTIQASTVDVGTLDSFSADCTTFYSSYTMADPFDYIGALETVVASAGTMAQAYAGQVNRLDNIYFAGATSLLDNPTAYLSSLAVSASGWPSTFSSALMSQATGILHGYESLVSKDILGSNLSQSITPGMSVTGSAATSNAAVATSNSQTSTMGPQATASSTGAGMVFASASPELIMSVAAAAAGVIGMVLL